MFPTCKICGLGAMTVVACKLHAGDIHMQHCRQCQYFDSLTWHCLYYITVIKPVEEREQAERDEQLRQAKREAIRRAWRAVFEK